MFLSGHKKLHKWNRFLKLKFNTLFSESYEVKGLKNKNFSENKLEIDNWHKLEILNANTNFTDKEIGGVFETPLLLLQTHFGRSNRLTASIFNFSCYF